MKNLVVVGTLALFTAGAVLADVEEVLCGKARFSLLADRMVRCEWSETVVDDRAPPLFVESAGRRGGYGTVVGAPDALKLWDTIGENYKRVISG